MELLAALVEVVKFTVGPVGRQFGYVLHYHSNIMRLKESVEILRDRREDVDLFVVSAQNNNEEVTSTFRKWMCKVDEITKQVENLCEEESRANTGCSHRSCPNLWLRHQISRKAKQMSAVVDELMSRFPEKVSYQTLIRSVGLPLVENEEFQSRISIMDEIMEALADPAVHVVGLYGLSGVGKTTFTKQVAMKAKVEKLFETVVWVEVKHNSVKEIQSQIAYQVGLQSDMQSESEIVTANRLCQRMEKEKSLLFILDDLWKRFYLKQAGIPFADEGNNHCKIILTSRNKDVLTSQMNCTRNIKMELLSEKEAWELFTKVSAINDDPDLLSIAAEVVRKCAQLPIAIVAVARALRNNKSPTKWNDALIQLKRHTSQNIPGVKDEVYCSIKLSYDYLESQELKSIFLLSAKLSHDPLITEIFMYSVGLDLLEGVHYLKEARVRLHTLVQQLKASSLLLPSYSKYRFRMHDIVRDVALFIASEEKHALVKRYEKVDEWPDNDQLESCTAICLDNSDIDEIPEELYGPKVVFFLLNGTDPDLRIPNNFFKGMKELKVLNLANMAFSSLPFSISLLKKLKTLSLHSCTLEDITIVEHLRRLKILNLSYSRIKRLPCEVARLSRIQMLNLNCCSELEVIPPNILSNLKKLEELYMEKSFNQWDAQGKERASLAELQHLQKLSILEINIPDASVLPKDLFLENSLEMYRISIGTSRVHFSDDECPKKLTLKLDNNIDNKYGVFKLLESVQDLYLENLNGITSLCQVVMSPRTFTKLRAIQVRCCHQLKFLFSENMVRTLSNLEKIEVFECKSIIEVFECKSIEQILNAGEILNVRGSETEVEFPGLRNLTLTSLPVLTSFCFNRKVVFPSLRILRLESINVQNLWQIPTSTSSGTEIPEIVGRYQSFTNLKVLKVEMCDFILKLIPLPLLKSLSNLQELWISSCLSLEVVFDFHELNPFLTSTDAFCLKILAVHKLPKLKTVWGKYSLKNFSFQNLQKITVSECESLESIFPASVAKDLIQLKELEIKSCGMEVLVVKDEFILDSFEFLKLTSIKLLDLPYLKNFYSQSHTSEWPLLQKLEIKDCNELEIFQPEFPDSLHIKYPLFSDEKVIPKLEVLTLDGRHAIMIWNGEFREYHFPNVKALYLSRISMAATFPYGLFYGFPNLECLEVSYSSFEVIFSDSRHLHDAQNVAPFKKLRLYLLQLKHLWNEKCQLDLVLHNLQSLEVFNCPRLLNLGPSFVSLKNLIDLEVNDCDRLINLFTSQTARTLIQLTRLIIKKCNNIREIITNGGEDLEEEIVFTNLKSLELFELPNCESFCCHSYSFMFPSLAEVTIRSCLRLGMFCPGVLTTPFLRGVKVENNEILWQSDLNITIEQLLAEKVAFRGTNLKLHEYPELIDIWKGKLPIPDRSFCNLASLVVENCDFLSNHVIPSYVLRSLINLKSLKVRNCDFVEVVFDLEGINIEEEAHKLQAIHLAKLTLDHLPNLEHVWNKDAHRIDCFQHLEYVHAY